MSYHQSQVDPCVFYRKYSVFKNYVDDSVIVSHKKQTITSLIESLNNGPENYVLTDEGDISNYLGVDINKSSYGTFKLSQSYLVEEIRNHVGREVSASLKSKDMLTVIPLLYKYEYSIGRK